MKPYLSLILCSFLVSNWASADASVSLSEYLSQVQTQSPALQIEKSLSDEASARANGVRIPPPMVGIMNMKDAGGTNQGIEISQEIPFPTKIAKDHEARQLEADVQKTNQIYRQNEVINKARLAYFSFWSAFEKTEILKEKRDWLKKHAKIARTATRSDSAAQIHLLGIESEVDRLENEVLESETKLEEARNALKLFTPDLNTDQISPQAPPLENIQIDPKSKSTMVSWKEMELKSAQANHSLKSQAYLPDLFIRYRGYNGNDSTDKSQEVMVGVTLPFVFFWQPQAESSESSARALRAEAELRKAKTDVEANLRTLSLKIENLQKQLLSLQGKILPRAHKRMKLVDTLSPRTMEGLDEHRSVMLDYLDLQTKSIDVRLELETSISELMTLVGQGERK
jgi:outer membrane protein TolC